MTVWDLKTKKASLTLNNNRKRVSAIAWDPHNSTKLLTATPDDNTPVILLWDLRNSNAPERTLQGHEQGILSLSWCEQDADLLLSCGKDNRTLLWNPQTGERYGEFPEVTNWTFLTRFNPHNPGLSATASFDGKIAIQTLQNTNPSTTQTTTQNSLDGEDFFTSAQTQPQGASFSLAKAPAWLRRPIGASFGFGGKVIVYKKNTAATGHPGLSKVVISQFSVDSDVTAEAEKFESSLQSGDLKAICASHLEQAKTEEEKADWRVIETLVAADPRQEVIDHLGFNKDEDDSANGDDKDVSEDKSDLLAPQENGVSKSKHKRMVSMFDGEQGDDFLAGLAANKGAKTEDPFHLLGEGNDALEDQVTKALMLGNFGKAAEICLKEDRMADAFIIANCGGKELMEKVQAAYLLKKKGSPSYLRLLSSVIAQNLWDVVYNADLKDWKETMATLCTYAKPDEFPDLCEALGDRVLEQGVRKDASFCYLVGSKLEKAVTIWIEELEEIEQASIQEPSEDSTFSVHARSLQRFIEKVTIFRHVTKFNDKETGLTSDWKLSALYDKYTEYADIVAAHGLLSVAQKYLDLLPASYPAAEVARNRVKLATQKGTGQAAARATTSTSRPAASRQQPVGYQPAQPQPTPSNPYGPPAPVPAQTPAANPYAPPGATPAPTFASASNPYAPSANPYAPAGATPYQPSQGYAPPQPAAFSPYGQTAMAPPPLGGPPRGPTPTSNPPLLRAKDVGDWNDLPAGVVKAAPARRSTPRAVVGSPFPNQQPAGVPPPPQSPYGAPPRGTATPPPPPPKAGAPPRVSSPSVGPPQVGQLPMRPPSTTSNPYAPPPPAAGAIPPPGVPPTGSPYNAPPTGAPPSSRYAPAPAVQQATQAPPLGGSVPPPPAASRPPPPDPYAPSAQAPAAPGPYGAPSPYSAATTPAGGPPLAPPPTAGTPLAGPPRGGPPMGGPPPPAQGTATPPPPRAAAPPPKPRHPAGDRSHIPANAQGLVDILSRDMQRVASKAPANFAPQVKDTQKRLNLLFDHLNNEELVKPGTIEQLVQLAEAIDGKNYDLASQIQLDVQKNKTEECGNWMVGFAVSIKSSGLRAVLTSIHRSV